MLVDAPRATREARREGGAGVPPASFKNERSEHIFPGSAFDKKSAQNGNGRSTNEPNKHE